MGAKPPALPADGSLLEAYRAVAPEGPVPEAIAKAIEREAATQRPSETVPATFKPPATFVGEPVSRVSASPHRRDRTAFQRARELDRLELVQQQLGGWWYHGPHSIWPFNDDLFRTIEYRVTWAEATVRMAGYSMEDDDAFHNLPPGFNYSF